MNFEVMHLETILYEYQLNFSDYLLNLIPLVIGIAFMHVFVLSIKDKSNETKRFIKIFSGAITFIIGILSLVIFIFITVSMSLEHIDYKNRLANNDVCVVEGYVENFHPMPFEGHDTERFNINGVNFEYSDSTIINGYHKSSTHGGVITHNGQYLKIKYVVKEYNDIKETVILYIAEIQQNE